MLIEEPVAGARAVADLPRGGEVVVLGSLNVDLVTRVAHHPQPADTVLGSPLRRLAGGKGANQALAASRAGARAHLVGCVGDDGYGRALRHGLALRGVDVSAVRTAEGVPTTSALITVDGSGEATVVVAAGANSQVDVSDIVLPGPGGVLLLQLELDLAVVEAAVHRAAAVGVRVVLNPSPVLPLPPEVLAVADPMVVNEREVLRSWSGGPRSLITTLGSRGARWYLPDGDVITVRSPRVDAVDRTGAGDAFIGTLAAALAAGADERQALEAGVLAGSDAVTAHGAQGWEI